MKTIHIARSWSGALFAALLLACLAPAAQAGGSAELQVTATVAAVTRLQVVSQPSMLQVTAADVARGYVEVPAAVEAVVRNNTGRGYLVMLESRHEVFGSAQVHGLAAPVSFGSGSGFAAQPALGRGTTTTRLALSFRFDLPAHAQPGTYPWPIQLSAQPA